MNTNTNNPSFLSYLQLLPLLALLFTTAYPKYALAYVQTAYTPQGMAFSTGQAIFDTPIPASYLFEEGSVLGVTVSAYSSTPEQTDGDPFTTASGTHVRSGIIASNFLPLGTVVRLGSNVYVVEDRLNARYNSSYRVDVWMESLDAARTFGLQRQILEVVSLPHY